MEFINFSQKLIQLFIVKVINFIINFMNIKFRNLLIK